MYNEYGGIMNKKGFTLIELLAVIIIIGIIAVITVPSVISYTKSANETSYNILIKNIVTASKTYYEECEYGDLLDSTKYGSYACQINASTINTTLGALANTGMLSVKDLSKDKETKEDKETKVVKDPRDTTIDMSDCTIQITKTKQEITDDNGIKNTKVTYTVTNTSSDSNCPTEYGSVN